MVKIEYPDLSSPVEIPVELLEGKRPLTYNEIQILEKNLNHNSDPSWKNFFVDEEGFDPSLLFWENWSSVPFTITTLFWNVVSVVPALVMLLLAIIV